VQRLAWSKVKSAHQPGLELELCMILELVAALSAGQVSDGVALWPSRILVGCDGSVAVDTGGAPPSDSEARYLAPEVLAGGALDARSMVFSVGALLFEAVTAVAFESPEQLMQELEGSRALARAAGLGSQFWEIYVLEAAAKATDASPDRRWPSLEELAREVERVAHKRIASRERLGEFVAEHLAAAGKSRRARRTRSPSAPRSPTPAAAPRGPEHQTLLGVGPEPAPLPAAAPPASHQTLVGVGPPSSERPLMLVTKAPARPAAGEPEKHPGEPRPTLSGPGTSSSSLIAASDVPPDTGSAVTTYPEKKSRKGKVLLVLVALFVLVAVPLEYFHGAVTRTMALVVPYLRARLSGEQVDAPTRQPTEEKPSAESAARPPSSAEGPRLEVDAGVSLPDQVGDACSDCEDSDDDGELDGVSPAEPKAVKPAPQPRRMPKRPAQDRDYGI
jgi:hypothetical protein